MAAREAYWVGKGHSPRWQDAGNWASEPGGRPGFPAPQEGMTAIISGEGTANLKGCPARVDVSSFVGLVILPNGSRLNLTGYEEPWWCKFFARVPRPRVSSIVGDQWAMKVRIGLASLVVLGSFLGVIPNAFGGSTLFWVGGTGTYDGTTNHFATTSGGVATVAAVTSADDVTVDSSSGSGTMTIGAAFSANSVTINSTTMTVACDGSHGITTAGAMTLTNGTFNTNNQACTFGTFVLAAGTKTLTLGSSAITITSTSGTALNFSVTANLTMTANTAVITQSGAGAGATLGAMNFNGLSLAQTGSGTTSLTSTAGGSTIANFTRTGTATKTDAFSSTGNSLTITGTCTLGGNTTQGVNRLFVTTTIGTSQTITAGAYVITKDVSFSVDVILAYTGAASWTNTASNFVSMPDGGSGAAFTNRTTPATQTATGTGSFTWSTHGWTSRVPLSQDDAVINNAFVGSPTITMDMPRAGKSISVGSTGNFTFTPSVVWSLYGNLTLAPVSGVMTWTTNGNALTFAGRGTQTITTNGITVGSGVTVNAPGGSYTLQDNFTQALTRQLTLTNGGFVDNGKTVTTGSFVSTGGLARTLTITGTWNLGGTGSLIVWAVAIGNLTLTANAVTLNITSTDSGVTKTFTGGTGTYGSLNHTTTGSAALTISDSGNTFGALNLQDTTARTITLPASGSQFITGLLTLAGASGQNLSLVSSSPGTRTTLVVNSAPSISNATLSSDVVLQYAIGDTGSGANTHTLGILDIDSSTPSEAQTLTAALLASDAGSASDDGSLAALLVGTQAGASTEATILAAFASALQSAVGLDASGQLVSLLGTDLAGHSDSGTLGAALTVPDSGHDAELAAVSTIQSDSGSGAENHLQGILGSDGASADESAAPVTSPTVVDSGVWFEHISITWAIDDVGHGVDNLGPIVRKQNLGSKPPKLITSTKQTPAKLQEVE